MEKLILKYNAIVGKDHLPEIQEITKKLCLEITDVSEESPIAGKRLKVISVTGSKENLDLLHTEMARFPAITTKPMQKELKN
jgi:hypothetical protein